MPLLLLSQTEIIPFKHIVYMISIFIPIKATWLFSFFALLVHVQGGFPRLVT